MKPESKAGWIGWARLIGSAIACLGGVSMAATESLTVPNASFEKPSTPFVSLLFDSWQRTAKPGWYVEEGGFQWTQLTGIFVNTAPGAADYIEALNGKQAAWLFAIPEAGLFQPVRNADGSGIALFEEGRSYRLSLDVLGNGGNMLAGVTLEAGLYRLDASSNRVTVASLIVTNSEALFGSRNRLTTFQVTTAPVSAADSWAGQPMGVQIVSTATLANQGGYWDIDHVRVEAITPLRPELVVVTDSGSVRLKWASEMGVAYRLRSTTQLGSWVSAGEPIAGTGGELMVVIPVGSEGNQFYSLIAESIR